MHERLTLARAASSAVASCRPFMASCCPSIAAVRSFAASCCTSTAAVRASVAAERA